MKRKQTLIVKFQSWNDFKAKVTKALKERERSSTPANVVVFGSVSAYQNFMTGHRIAILAALATKKPSSVFQLAQLVDRDFANVHQDCVRLTDKKMTQGYTAFYTNQDDCDGGNLYSTWLTSP